MDPGTLSAAAIATLLLTKTIEKLGEKLGEKIPDMGAKVWEQIGKLKQLLWRKAPETATAIERVTYQPELVEEKPADYGLEVLSEKMESVAQTEPEVAEVIEALAREVRPKLPPKVVRQVMASGIRVKGSMKAGKMTQKAQPGMPTDQTMVKDVETGGNMILGDLSQEG